MQRFRDKNIRILTGVFIVSLSILQPWMRPDGIRYYAYIRSLVIDNDLQFENEFKKDAIELNQLTPPMLRGIEEYRPSEHLGGVSEYLLPLTKTGYVPNQTSVGSSLLWSPFFLLAHMLVNILNRCGMEIPADGYSFPYMVLVSFGSCLYGFIGLILAYKICKRYFSDGISLGVTIAVWWASPLPAYMYGHPVLSHTSSAFAISLLLFLYLKIRDRESLPKWLALGFIGGVAAIVRPQDILFLLIPGIEFLRQYYIAIKNQRPSGLLRIIKKNILFLAGFLTGILPQLIVSRIIYGVYTLDFYHQAQDDIVWKWFSPPIFQVLFSSCHGLFSWTPLLLFAVTGLYFFYAKDAGLALVLTVIFFLQVYVVSGAHSHTGYYIWEYSSFGGRMFLSCTPVFILGLGALVDGVKSRVRKIWLILIAAGFILWNLGFILQFALGIIPREEKISWPEMFHNQFTAIPFLVYNKIVSPFLFVIIILAAIVALALFYFQKKRLIKMGGTRIC